MKRIAVVWFAALISMPCWAEEDDPFGAEVEPERPRPERDIKKLPKSVTYEKKKGGAHTYTIKGLYIEASVEEGADLDYDLFVPECTSFEVNVKSRSCVFVTSRQLTLSELAYVIDDLAHFGGEVPYWQELEARDIERSPAFGAKKFSVKRLAGEFPAGLAWFWIPKDREVTTPFHWIPFEAGKLLIVPKTAHCMAHARFSMRILDEEGKLVWQDSTTALAAVRFAIADPDGDGSHEIYLDRDDHGKEDRFHIRLADVEGKVK